MIKALRILFRKPLERITVWVSEFRYCRIHCEICKTSTEIPEKCDQIAQDIINEIFPRRIMISYSSGLYGIEIELDVGGLYIPYTAFYDERARRSLVTYYQGLHQ